MKPADIPEGHSFIMNDAPDFKVIISRSSDAEVRIDYLSKPDGKLLLSTFGDIVTGRSTMDAGTVDATWWTITLNGQSATVDELNEAINADRVGGMTANPNSRQLDLKLKA